MQKTIRKMQKKYKHGKHFYKLQEHCKKIDKNTGKYKKWKMQAITNYFKKLQKI